MHDFLQSLAYNGSASPFGPVPRRPDEPLRCIMLSFDGAAPAAPVRPGPRATAGRKQTGGRRRAKTRS